MFKFFILLLIVNNVISVEIVLARMVVLFERDSGKNQFVHFQKIKENGNTSTVSPLPKHSCENDAITRLDNNNEKIYLYGSDLSLTWKKGLRLYQLSQLTGRMTIKYDSDKYEDVTTPFVLCQDINKIVPKNEKSDLAKEIFFEIFIKKYESYWDCIEKKTLKVGDNYYWERGMVDIIHCDANATIRMDLYGVVDADCGIGGSGESFTYNILRVFFNVKFDNCDGKKYEPFKTIPKSVLGPIKLAEAKEIAQELSKNPILF